MVLQGRAGAHRGNGTLDESGNGILLPGTEGEQNDLLGVHDRADAHRHRLRGDFVDLPAEEETRIVLNRLLGQDLRMRPASQGAAGFVEGDVPIRADTEQLNINASGGGDGILVCLAGGCDVLGETIGDVRPRLVDVDVVEELRLHEVVIALVVLRRETEVLVQIKALAVLE